MRGGPAHKFRGKNKNYTHTHTHKEGLVIEMISRATRGVISFLIFHKKFMARGAVVSLGLAQLLLFLA